MSVDGIQRALFWINLKGPTSSFGDFVENMLKELVSIDILASHKLALPRLKS